MENIRAKRERGGLLRQHLTAVLAASEIGSAQVEGATLGSKTLTFTPGSVRSGTASVNLIWPLLIFSFGPTLW
jgi:RNA 3'-terminal phosphate cyclase (ATP)